MSKPAAQEAPPATAVPLDQGVRVVLFGRTDAGKSSLLGALAQAAQTQQHVLNGSLQDATEGLKELQSRVYQDRGRETADEIAPYPVVFESLNKSKERVEAVLIDSNGQVAYDYLEKREALTAKEGQLAEAILQADALLLIVDAATPKDQLQRDFRDFLVFLRLFEQSRGQRSEVGGLPVYLVLTKCDLLAEKSDSPSTWIQRIEERKRTVYSYFQKYLAQESSVQGMGFGKVNLRIWATAVRKPALKNQPARPNEPFGVAELFRQVFPMAQTFHKSRLHAGRRLGWTVAAMALLVGVMLTAALVFFLTRPSPEVSELETKIQEMLPGKAIPKENRLDKALTRQRHLERLMNDPLFPHVSDQLQSEVKKYHDELGVYLKDYAGYVDAAPNTTTIDSYVELHEAEKFLENTEFPEKYELLWEPTFLGRMRKAVQKDVKVLRRAVPIAVTKFAELSKKIQKIKDTVVGSKLKKAGEDLIDDVSDWPYFQRNLDQPIDGSRITYNQILQFEGIRNQYREWQKFKKNPQQYLASP